MLRVIPLFAALILILAPASQALLVSSSPKTQVPAFLPNEPESRIGLLVGNDPLDRVDPMGLDAIPDSDGSYHFELRSDFNPQSLLGTLVSSRTTGKCYQCLGAAQFLTGTRTSNGVVHDAPRHGDLYQGEKVSAATPNGTMIATGFRDGKYPSESKLTDAQKAAGVTLNHTIIKTGFDPNSQDVTGIGQNASRYKTIQSETHNVNDGAGWYVVRSQKPMDAQATDGTLARPTPVPQKSN